MRRDRASFQHIGHLLRASGSWLPALGSWLLVPVSAGDRLENFFARLSRWPIWWNEANHSSQIDEGSSNTLSTTHQHWQDIAELIRDPKIQSHTSSDFPLHVEVETYSWHVLPDHLKSGRGLHIEIKRELEALKAILLPSI